MDVEISQFENHKIRIRVTGRIDALNYELFEKKIKTIKKMGYSDLVLDLKNATYLNISSMILILQMSKEFNKRHDGLIIFGANHKIKERMNAFGSKHLRWESNN